MKYDLVIKNSNVVFIDRVEKKDVGIIDGIIVEISEEISSEAKKTIDASGKYLFSGLIDSHVHFNEPGKTEWETIKTGSSAIAAGGGTLYFDMPLNSLPCTVDRINFNKKLDIAEKKSITDFCLWAGLTPDNLSNINELSECGAIGFKAFSCFSGLEEFKAADDYTILKGMEQIKKFNLPLMIHCENDEITEKLTEISKNENRLTAKDFINSRPVITETETIRRMICLSEETGCKTIIAHVSTAKGVEMISKARQRGVNVFCESIGHYLVYDEEDVFNLGTILKCCPPIRNKENKNEIWKKVFNGDINIISSDHSPSNPSLKEKEFLNAWGGISSCQSTLNLLLTFGYFEKDLPLSEISKLTSYNPSEIYDLKSKGEIKIGNDADFSIVNLSEEFVLENENLFYLHKFSPYVGLKLKGKVEATILRGTEIFSNGKIVSEPIGKFIRPNL